MTAHNRFAAGQYDVVAAQQPSPMPIHKYAPFAPVELPDRTWPASRSRARPAGARSTCATATRP